MESIGRSVITLFALMSFHSIILPYDGILAQERQFMDGPQMQRHKGMHGPDYSGGRLTAMRNFFEDLGITQEQRAKLMNIRRESNVRSLRDRLNDERNKLREMFRDRSKNDKDILAQLDKVSNAQLELNQTRVKNVLSMRSILTEEQFNKLSERLQNRRPPMENHERGRGGFSMGGGMRERPQFQDGGMPNGEWPGRGMQRGMERGMPEGAGPDGGMIDPFDIE